VSNNFRIAFRFLTARRRAMVMSLACIILGVGLFVVTQATTTGFEKFFIDTILGTNGAIRVEDRIQDTLRTIDAERGAGASGFVVEVKEGRQYVEGIQEPKALITALREFSNVLGTSVVLHGTAEIRSTFKTAQARIFGIHLEDHLEVSELGRQIIQGELAEFRRTAAGTLVGRQLAERLQLHVGDSFTLQAGTEQRRYRVSAIYQTGIGDIDKERIFMHMGESRSLLKRPTGASFIQVNLIDRNRAPLDAMRMEAVLQHSASSWQEREEIWLDVFRALRLSTGITVSVFTLIAGIAMYNTLALVVMEKTKDIAILRSMGYTRQDITRVFLWQAVAVLTVGAILGCCMGAAITYGVSRTEIRIRGIFATDHFIVDWSPWHYVAAVGISVVMVMTASLIPARRAARLEPGDVIRGSAQ